MGKTPSLETLFFYPHLPESKHRKFKPHIDPTWIAWLWEDIAFGSLPFVPPSQMIFFSIGIGFINLQSNINGLQYVWCLLSSSSNADRKSEIENPIMLTSTVVVLSTQARQAVEYFDQILIVQRTWDSQDVVRIHVKKAVASRGGKRLRSSRMNQ